VNATTRRSVRTRLFMLGVVTAAIGWALRAAPPETPGRAWWPHLLAAGFGVVLALAGHAWHRRCGSAGRVERWSEESRRRGGVASPWQILRVASRFAVRRRAKILRPSLAMVPFRTRLFVRTNELATAVAKVGLLQIWSPVEDVTLRVGGPRVGKSGELACRILDAPGAVIATSTRTDLLEICGPVRARYGPVSVFNPCGVGGIDSTVTFDPLAGCEHPAAAAARAADLLSGASAPGGQGSGDREFWTAQARRVLAALLHAAALGEASMRDVLAWVADPDEGAAEVRRCLRRSPEPAYESDALQFLGTNERTRSSICATIMPALGWLTDSTAAAAATGGGFDVEKLLATSGTVFMLGAEDAQVTPLVTALTGHIAREARRIAGNKPGGRLDPPLTLALDEAALICPIPLDNWTADMGGRGVTIHIAVQSRAQLRARWGDTGAAAITNNAATLLIYGGSRDYDDLQAYSALTGERYEDVPTWDEDGKLTASTNRRVPVLTGAQIAALPPRHVAIIRRGMPCAVGTVQMAWKRPEVRRARRALRWRDRTERWATARDAAWQVAQVWTQEIAVPRGTAAAARLEAWLDRRNRPRRGRGGSR